MLVPKSHRLVEVDLRAAFDWFEDQRPGLGAEFADEFRIYYRRICESPLRNAIRFNEIRRLNLRRFPYGIFYAVRDQELRILAVLHSSRDAASILADRRRTFASGR